MEIEILKLERVQDALDDLRARKQNYELRSTPTGDRVYRLKDDAGTGELPHEVCPDCFEGDQIRILQPRAGTYICTSCEARFYY